MRSTARIATLPKHHPARWFTAALVAGVLCLLPTGCENLVARGSGGSETGVSNAEFGIRF